jgi:hypothetical protein
VIAPFVKNEYTEFCYELRKMGTNEEVTGESLRSAVAWDRGLP